MQYSFQKVLKACNLMKTLTILTIENYLLDFMHQNHILWMKYSKPAFSSLGSHLAGGLSFTDYQIGCLQMPLYDKTHIATSDYSQHISSRSWCLSRLWLKQNSKTCMQMVKLASCLRISMRKSDRGVVCLGYFLKQKIRLGQEATYVFYKGNLDQS